MADKFLNWHKSNYDSLIKLQYKLMNINTVPTSLNEDAKMKYLEFVRTTNIFSDRYLRRLNNFISARDSVWKKQNIDMSKGVSPYGFNFELTSGAFEQFYLNYEKSTTIIFRESYATPCCIKIKLNPDSGKGYLVHKTTQSKGLCFIDSTYYSER